MFMIKSVFLKHLKPFLLANGFDYDAAIAKYKASAKAKADEAAKLASGAAKIAADGKKAYDEAIRIAQANLATANKAAAAEYRKADAASAEAKATMKSANYLAG